MKIKIEGNQSINKLGANIKNIVKDIQERAGAENLPFKIESAEITLVFMVNGEAQYLTVNHEGVNEIFTVACEVDKRGNVIKAVDNESRSFLDDYTRAVAKGEVKEYPVIESCYKDEELDKQAETDGGDMKEVAYIHRPTGATVLRYYKNGELIGEVATAEPTDK